MTNGLPITANKRNCLTQLYLDNKVMEVGSIRLFATVGNKQQRQQRMTQIKHSTTKPNPHATVFAALPCMLPFATNTLAFFLQQYNDTISSYIKPDKNFFDFD